MNSTSDTEPLIDFRDRHSDRYVMKDNEYASSNTIATGLIGRLLQEAKYQDRHIDELLYEQSVVFPNHASQSGIGPSYPSSVSLHSHSHPNDRIVQPIMSVPNFNVDQVHINNRMDINASRGSYTTLPGQYETSFMGNMHSMLPLRPSSDNLYDSRNASLPSMHGVSDADDLMSHNAMTQNTSFCMPGPPRFNNRCGINNGQHLSPSFTAIPSHIAPNNPLRDASLMNLHQQQSWASFDDKLTSMSKHSETAQWNHNPTWRNSYPQLPETDLSPEAAAFIPSGESVEHIPKPISISNTGATTPSINSGAESGPIRKLNKGKAKPKPEESSPNDSSLLGKVRSGRVKDVPLAELVPHIHSFTIDQFGSRYLQNILDVCGRRDEEQYVNMLINNIDINAISEDIFGNYVIQKLIQKATPENRKRIALTLEPYIVEHSLRMCGCRVMQALIDYGDNSVHDIIYDQIKGNINQMVENQNGNHVIQRSISKMSSEHVDKICLLIEGSATSFAVHGYGCRVMQRILENASTQFISNVSDEMLKHAEELIVHKYGNYVLQHISRYGEERHHQAVYDLIVANFTKYAVHKYASNVVEKCLKFGAQNYNRDLKPIVDFVMTTKGTVHDFLIDELAYDRYANYVVQRLFECVSEDQKKRIYDGLSAQMEELKNSSFGKHLAQALTEKFGEQELSN